MCKQMDGSLRNTIETRSDILKQCTGKGQNPGEHELQHMRTYHEHRMSLIRKLKNSEKQVLF